MKIAEALKAHLRANKKKFIDHYDWNGSTETGFYSNDEFDHDALDNEIDLFCAEFEKINDEAKK